MPKKTNIKGYYNDKTNYSFTVAIKDLYFTKKVIKKTFVYRDDYLYTKEEAEENAIKLANHLLKNREYKEKPLKEYLDEITFVDKSWI